MRVETYRDLIVWQKGIALAKTIYQLTEQFPIDERYGLTAQMRRAAVSIPSNIAEGQSRRTTRDFVKHLYIAQGSRAELETQLILSKEFGFGTLEKLQISLEGCNEVGRLLTALTKSLRD